MIDNYTMSDDKVVASYGPSRSLLLWFVFFNSIQFNLTCLRRHAFCFVFNKSFFISISCIFSCSHYMDTMNFFGGKWMRLCRPCHESCATCFGVGALTNRYFCLSVSYRRWIVKTGSYWRVSFAVLFVLLISCLRDI